MSKARQLLPTDRSEFTTLLFHTALSTAERPRPLPTKDDANQGLTAALGQDREAHRACTAAHVYKEGARYTYKVLYT